MTLQLATNNGQPAIQRDKLLELSAVEQITGLKKSTIYLLMRRGEFPHGVKVTPKCVRWPESRVLQWVQDKINPSHPGGDSGAAP